MTAAMASSDRTPVFWTSPFSAPAKDAQQQQQQQPEGAALQPALAKLEAWALSNTESEASAPALGPPHRMRSLGGARGARSAGGCVPEGGRGRKRHI